MKKALLIVTLSLGIVGCHAQSEVNNKDSAAQYSTEQNKPQVSCKVNRQFDENGHLIRFDSTFSWSFSGNAAEMPGADSVLDAFRKQFSSGFLSFYGERFGLAGWSDSLFSGRLVNPGLFLDKHQDSYIGTTDFISKLDSLCSSFFDDDFAGLITKP